MMTTVENVQNKQYVRWNNWTYQVLIRPTTKRDGIELVSWDMRSPVDTSRQEYFPFGTEIEVVENK